MLVSQNISLINSESKIINIFVVGANCGGLGIAIVVGLDVINVIQSNCNLTIFV